MEALLADEGDDAAMLGLGFAGPGEVAAELSGRAFEEVEVIVCWWRRREV